MRLRGGVSPLGIQTEEQKNKITLTWHNSCQLIAVNATAVYELQIPLSGKSPRLSHRLKVAKVFNECMGNTNISNHDIALMI